MRSNTLLRKLKNKRSFLVVPILLVAAFLLVVPKQALAIGSLYISPGTSSVQINSNVTVAIRINPGTSVDSVEAQLQYDSSKLQFVSINDSGSAFTLPLAQSGGGGTVSIERGIIGSVTSDALVARVVFRALTGSGSTSLSVSGNAAWAGSYTSPSSGSATINFRSPSAPTPSNPTPTPPSTPSTPRPNQNQQTPGTRQPSNVSVAAPGIPTADDDDKVGVTAEIGEVQFTKAKLNVKTGNNARVYVRFGLGPEQLNYQTALTERGKTHEIAFDEKLLIPGTTFYYQVIAEGADGSRTIKGVTLFKTKGYTVRITVKDKENKPLKDKQLTLFSDPMSGRTDKQGVVEFNDVSPGQHKLEYKAGETTHSSTIQIEDAMQQDASGNQAAVVQNVSVVYGELTQKDIPIATIAALCAVLAVLGGIIVLATTRRGSGGGSFKGFGGGKSAKQPVAVVGSSSPQPPVTTSVITPTAVTPAAPVVPGSATAEIATGDRVYHVEVPKQHNPGTVVQPTNGSDSGRPTLRA